MMKFVAEQLSENGGRLGRLTSLRSCPEAVYQTPMVVLTTQMASVPHITEDNLGILLEHSTQEENRQLDAAATLAAKGGSPDTNNALQPQPRPLLSVACQHFANRVNTLTKYEKGVTAFAALPEFGCTVSVHSPIVTTASGYNDNSTVSVWTSAGRQKITAKHYMEVASSLQCDWCEALHNSDSPRDCSGKRLSKCTKNTTAYTVQCLQLAHHLPKIGGVLVPLIGGWDVAARKRYCEALKEALAEDDSTAQRAPVSGYSLTGLHNNGPGAEDITPGDEGFLQCIEASLSGVQGALPRVAQGGYSPLTVLSLVKQGVDVYDTTLPCLATDRGAALTFSYGSHSTDDFTAASTPIDEQHINKKLKMDDNVATSDDIDSKEKTDVQEYERPYEINLKNKKYSSDHSALLAGCRCYACGGGYTRSYLHHLSRSNEMVLPLLLNMHNLHHWLAFFSSIRVSVAADSLHLLTDTVAKSCQPR